MKHTSLISGGAFFFLALQLLAAPLDVWHWRNPAPQGNVLNGIVYGNGCFVAVGEGGTVLVSTNGADWEMHLRFDEDGNPIPMGTVAFGNGVFVSSRNYYGMWVSTNGVDWQPSPGPDVDSVVFCGSVFHAGAYASSNGLNWTFAPVPANGQINGAAFGNGTTVLVGNHGTISVTTNGLDWMAVTNSGATQDLICATFDGQQFFAAGWHGALFVSGNGINWTNRSVADEYYFLAAASHNGRIVLAGYSYAVVLDGGLILLPASDPIGVRALTVVNGEFWGVGEGGLIVRSTDGIDWTEVSSHIVLPAYMSFGGVAFDGRKFVAAGWNYVFASTNGVKWTQMNSPWELWIGDITWGNGRFVAVGGDISYPLGQPISSSADGTNWVLHSVPTNYVDSFQRVFFLNGRFVAIGYGGRIATSVSGTNWAVQSLSDNVNLSAATYGDGTYLVGGMNAIDFETRHSVLYSSTDLTTWTSNSVPIAEDFWDMTYGRGIFLAAYIRSGGPEGLMSSRDGKHWTSQPGFAERVLYQNGVFVIAGVNNISTSFNARAFRLRNRMFNQVPNGIAFGHGTYVVVGTQAMIIQSGVIPPAFMLSLEHDNPALGPLLRLDSPFDAAYNVQSSSDGSTWNTFTTVQSTNGSFAFRDTNGVGSGMKLYRAVLP